VTRPLIVVVRLPPVDESRSIFRLSEYPVTRNFFWAASAGLNKPTDTATAAMMMRILRMVDILEEEGRTSLRE
jgi:hypothetical protein